jgi:hypothetical protein
MSTIALTTVATAQPFEAYLLPVQSFPIPSNDLAAVDSFFRDFCAEAMKTLGLSTEVFFQLEQLVDKKSRTLMAEHGKAWLPETGLGVWVDRDPPQKWTMEEITNFVPGDKLRPIMFQVFRVSSSQQERIQARSLMLPYGPVLEILTSSGETFLPSIKPVFSANITDRSYTCFPYYVGLIEVKTMARATVEQLNRWFQGMTIYIRQSFEDQGILIASAMGLARMFEAIGGVQGAAGWRF